jgi:hypothetical protein
LGITRDPNRFRVPRGHRQRPAWVQGHLSRARVIHTTASGCVVIRNAQPDRTPLQASVLEPNRVLGHELQVGTTCSFPPEVGARPRHLVRLERPAGRAGSTTPRCSQLANVPSPSCAARDAGGSGVARGRCAAYSGAVRGQLIAEAYRPSMRVRRPRSLHCSIHRCAGSVWVASGLRRPPERTERRS